MNHEPEHKTEPGPGGTEAVIQSDWWVGGWLAPTAVVMFTIFWSLLAYWLIGSRARDWEYGTVPYVPAESVFTTQEPSNATPPKQVMLPQPTQGGTNAQP